MGFAPKEIGSLPDPETGEQYFWPAAGTKKRRPVCICGRSNIPALKQRACHQFKDSPSGMCRSCDHGRSCCKDMA